jgi:hypothetical protein
MGKRSILFGLSLAIGLGFQSAAEAQQARGTFRVGFRILPVTTIEKNQPARPIALISSDASSRRPRATARRSGPRVAGGVSTIYLGPLRPTY